MNADTLKRIVRAIAEDSQDDLKQLVKKIVDIERNNGHTKLADQLDTILNQGKHINRSPKKGVGDRALRELPLSRRYGELLASFIPRDALEHNMVLPANVEAKFIRIEREYAARERLGVYGLKPKKTILLHGPSGCGKSLGAKRLAWNISLPLMKVRFDALLSSYFGESASNLRAVFDAAKERPCVLVLDECDFIARSRTNTKDIGEASRIANTLLLLMEEYDAPGLLVATTNIESSLDEALFRRFDDAFLIPPPGLEEIDRLLRLTLSSVQVAESLDWKKFVQALEGQSAAQVVKFAQDAAKAAVLTGKKIVDNPHFEAVLQDLREPLSR